MEGKSNVKLSLLKKFDIPLENLSYEYIGQCSNITELERIVRILRSGEEGLYPDLIRVAEEQLKKFAPNSRVLRVLTPALKKDSFSSEEWKKVEDDLIEWENEMNVLDKGLEFEKKRFDTVGNKNVPEVRQVKPVSTKVKQVMSRKIEANEKNTRIKSNDYSAWAKFDVDKELLKMDIEDERREEELKKKKKLLVKKTEEKQEIGMQKIEEQKDEYGTTEQRVLAVQAKDRGNECFKVGDLENALKYYNISLKLHSTAATFNNRAMTYLKLERYKEAIADCNKVLEVEPCNVKALLRRATAYKATTPPELIHALNDLTKVVQVEPNNKSAQLDLQQLCKQLNVDDGARRVRMKITECDRNEAPVRRSPWNINREEAADLPLTFYGPSTSHFRVEPYSRTHRLLLGPAGYMPACRCNNNAARQNPLCQRCGEIMSRPPARQVKFTNDLKNQQLKQAKKLTITEIHEDTKANVKLNGPVKIEEDNKQQESRTNNKVSITEETEARTEISDLKTEVTELKKEMKESKTEEKESRAGVSHSKTGIKESETEKEGEKLDTEVKVSIKEGKVSDAKEKESKPDEKRLKVEITEQKTKEKGSETDDNDTKEEKEEANQILAIVDNNHVNKNSSSHKDKKSKKKKKKKHHQQSGGNSEGNVAPSTIVQASKYICPVTAEPKKEQECSSQVSCRDKGWGHSKIGSGYQFMKNWETCSKTDEDYSMRAKVLMSIQPADLPKLAGNKLDGEMLIGILRCLDRHIVQSDGTTAAALLNFLPTVPRYSTVAMFLDRKEKTVLEKLVQKVEGQGHVLSTESKNILLYGS